MAVHTWDGNAWQTSGDSGQAAKPVATSAGAVHQWDGKAWVSTGSTEGCGVSVVDDNRGPPGPAGAPGPPGATGATGSNVIISDTPPPNPAPSDLWFESDSGNLAIYYDDGDSRQWVGVGGSAASGLTDAPADGTFYARKDGAWERIVMIRIGDTPPASPQPGQLWWESVTGAFYIRYDDGDSQQWVEAGGENSTTTKLIRELAKQLAETNARLTALEQR